MKRVALLIFCLVSGFVYAGGNATARLMRNVPSARQKQPLVGANASATPSATDTPSAAAPSLTTSSVTSAKSAPAAGLGAIAAPGVNPMSKGSGLLSSPGGGAGGGKGAAGKSSGAFSYNSGGGGGGFSDSGEGGGGDSGGGGQKKKSVAFAKWYPMCIFMDGGVRNGNEVVKGLVDMAAKCSVNLVVFPFYTKNLPGSGDGAKNAARNKCNAQDGFRQYGVNRASAIVLTGNGNIPAQMCHTGGKDSNQCGEMGWQVDEGTEARLRSTNRWSDIAPPGKPAVGAVASSNGVFDIYKVAAVTGQTFLNRPPGYGGGNGVGSNFEGQAAGGAGDNQGWSQDGCKAMQEASFNNDGRWKYSPDQNDYVVKGDDEKRFLDLAGKKPIFRTPGGDKSQAQADSGGGMGGSGGGGGGGGGARPGGGGGRSPGGSAPSGGAFAFSKSGNNSVAVAGRESNGRSGRSGSEPLYSDATGGPDSSPAPEIPFTDAGESSIAAANQPGAPGIIPGKPGAIGGPGGQTLIGYDESASRNGGTFSSALSSAAAFFGLGSGTPGAEDPKKKGNGLDSDFFKKLAEEKEKEPGGWRRKPGSSLRRDPEAGTATASTTSRGGAEDSSSLPKRESQLRAGGATLRADKQENASESAQASAESSRPERNGNGMRGSRAPASSDIPTE